MALADAKNGVPTIGLHMTKRIPIKRALNWFGWGVALVFFVLAGWRLVQGEDWSRLLAGVDWRGFGMASVLLFVGLGVRALSGWVAHRALDLPLTLAQSYRYWFMSQMSKYIPGGVWQFAARSALYHRAGTPLTLGAVMSFWEVAAILLSGLALVAVSGTALTGTNTVFVVAATVGLVVSIALSQSRWAWRRVARLRPGLAAKSLEVFDAVHKRRYTAMVALSLLALVGWAFIGVGFHVLVFAVTPDAPLSLRETFFAYVLAWVVGFLVVIAPGGLGAREAVIVAALTPSLGATPAFLVAVLSRGWWMLVEGIHIGIAMLMSFMVTEPEKAEAAHDPA